MRRPRSKAAVQASWPSALLATAVACATSVRSCGASRAWARVRIDSAAPTKTTARCGSWQAAATQARPSRDSATSAAAA